MQRLNGAKVWFGGWFVLLASLWIFARASAAGDAYTPAPPIAVPVPSGLERHGLLIAARHSRTRLVDGYGLSLWNDPSCGHASHVDAWHLDSSRAAVIDPPSWLKYPVHSNAWLAVGIVPGLRIHFEAPVAKTGRVREIVAADPSVAFGWYCVYEEFYRTPSDPAAGGEAYWSRVEVEAPAPGPNYFAGPGYPAVASTRRQPPRVFDNSGWPAPAPTATPRFEGSTSFFPPRPPHVAIRYRTGVLTDWENGNKSGWAAIKDAAGNTFGYFTGWPMYIDGKQSHCAIAPRRGEPIDPIDCGGGWPADMVIGVTRVRVYYWHDVTPWGQHVEVTDQIIKAPHRD